MPTAVVLNLPEHGHINTSFPLMRELVERGERVVCFATEPFRLSVEQSGAHYESYGSAEAFIPPAHTGGLYSAMDWAMTLTESLLPSLIERIRAIDPDYLLIDSMCVWGALARQILDLPAAMLASVFVPNPDHVTVDEMVQRAYGHADKETLLAGIAALDNYIQSAQRIDRKWGTLSPNLLEFFANQQSLNLVFTSREFHLAGDSYDESYKFVGPSIPCETREFNLPAGRGPLIYISLGTIFNEQASFYRACFDALGSENCRVILATGSRIDANDLGPTPSNFTLYEHAPQTAILHHADAFVTHGGMNSTNEALWHGVPLLVYPQHGDQHLVAARVAELGAGLTMRPPDAAPDSLRALIQRLLQEPSWRREARRIGQSLRAAGGPTRAADEILTWRPER